MWGAPFASIAALLTSTSSALRKRRKEKESYEELAIPKSPSVTGNEFEGDKTLSFRMDVKVEKVLEDGAYEAKLVNVEQKETKFGDRLMWTFAVAGESTEVVGFTSMSPSTKAKAYQWAVAIAEEIDPKLGWGPEDLIGGECNVVLEAAEDAQGTEKNKVAGVKPPRKDKLAASEREADSSGGNLVQIPL
jgi:hypothetical protein